MKIEVNLEKKYFISLILIGLFMIGFVGVYAYNAAGTGGNPAVFGHSVDEMSWNKAINANVTINATLNVSRICIGNDCKTAWPSAASSQWVTSGSNIYYSAGNVSVPNYLNAGVGIFNSGICIGTSCITSWPSGGGSYVARDANCGWVADTSGGDLNIVPTCPDNKFVRSAKFGVSDNNVNRGYLYCCDIQIVPV